MGDEVDRLKDAYAALVDRRFDLIPRFFDPVAVYRSSGVFPGIKPVYEGHEEIEALLRLSTEPWETLEVEVVRICEPASGWSARSGSTASARRAASR